MRRLLARRRQTLETSIAAGYYDAVSRGNLFGRRPSASQGALLDAIELGIITTDPSGNVTFVNRTARQLLGMRSATWGNVRDILDLRSSPSELALETPKLSYSLTTHYGEEVDLELSVRRADSSNPSTEYFFIFRDVHDEKTWSAERERFERLAAIGTMVAGFAHEVRNPVAALRSLAESLAESLADANVEVPHVSRMLQVLERIERLVRTSLQFGRPLAPQRRPHPPWTIVAAAISELTSRTRELGGQLRVEADPDVPEIFVDDAQMIQVLVILVNNALDAVGAPDRVLVRVERASAPAGVRKTTPPGMRPSVRFEVRDDGPGIPAEILGRVFDPFFTTKPAGTGLGLSIAQHIVSENGGSIEAVSPRGGPTSFMVTLPTEPH